MILSVIDNPSSRKGRQMKNALLVVGSIVVVFVIYMAVSYVTAAYEAGPNRAIQIEKSKVDRQVNTSSQQWDETKLTEIGSEIAQYEQNEVYLARLAKDADGNAQLIESLQMSQKTLTRRIHAAAVQINNPNSIPDNVRSFLSSH